MTHDQFFKSLKSGDIQSIYVFSGVEQHVKNSALQTLRTRLLPEGFEQLNESIFEGAISAAEVIESAETLPLMCDKRLVLVKDWPLLLPGKAKNEGEDTEQMLTWLKNVPESVCLILWFTEQPDSRKKLAKELKSRAEWVQFDLLNDADILKWSNRQIKEAAKKISPEAVEQLVFMAGRSLTSLAQELDKLCSYIGTRDTITPADVEAVVTPSTECTVFQMIDCVLRRQGVQAQMLLKNMLENGESRIGALAMLTRQLRMLTHIRLMRNQGMNIQEIERKLSLNHFAASRAAAQAGKFTLESLQEGYRACVETDYAIKSGRMRDAAALDYLMLKLSSMK